MLSRDNGMEVDRGGDTFPAAPWAAKPHIIYIEPNGQ